MNDITNTKGEFMQTDNTFFVKDEKNTTDENFQTMAEVEKAHFLKAMEVAGGNKSKVAKLLGLTIKTVYNKIDRYNGKTLTVGDKNVTE